MEQNISELRSQMVFRGYRSLNLDEIERSFTKRFDKIPSAYLVRSPYMIRGSMENKRKLVVSRKYCGYRAIFVPIKLSKSRLEHIINMLGDTSEMIYVQRRAYEKIAIIEELNQDNNRTYRKHCTYCGTQYITDVVRPDPHCGNPVCASAHKRHREMQRRLRAEEANKKKEFVDTKEEPEIEQFVPEIELDDPTTATLQGYVYCIRAANGLCKIGRSSNVADRFATVVTHSPIEVFLEHTVFSDNYVLAESYAHSRLGQYHHHGEWYDLPNDVFEWFMGLDNYDLDALQEFQEAF